MSVIVPANLARKKDARLSFRTTKALEAALSFKATLNQRSTNAEFENIIYNALYEFFKEENLVSLYCYLNITLDFIIDFTKAQKDEQVEKCLDEIRNNDKLEYIFEGHFVFKSLTHHEKVWEEVLLDEYKEELRKIENIPLYYKIPKSLTILFKGLGVVLHKVAPGLYESNITLDAFVLPHFLSNLKDVKMKNGEIIFEACKDEPLVNCFKPLKTDQKSLKVLALLDSILLNYVS